MVLRIIHEHHGVAMRDITGRTGLNPAIVKHHVDKLVKEGEVCKTSASSQGRGRPADILRPNPRSGYLVGVDMDPHRITAVVADMAHKVIATTAIPINPEASHTEIVDGLAQATRDVITDASVPQKRVRGVGVALTGFYDHKAGIAVMSSSLPRWRNVPVRYLLEEMLPYPLVIDDSVAAATMAEKWFGKGVGVRDFISLRVRTGLSLGVVIDGELYRGLGNAGAINHLHVMPHDTALEVSQPRMLFDLASGHAILRRIREQADASRSPVLWELIEGDPQRIDLEALLEAGKHRDPLCVKVLCEAASCWGRALAQALELLHPERVIVTGTFAELADLLEPPLVESLKEVVLPPFREKLDVQFSELGKLGGAMGAAAMVLGRVIQSS